MSARKTTPGTPYGSAFSSPVKNGTAATMDDEMNSYTTFSPCPHLKKVLSSSAKDMVLKTYTTGVKICLMATPSEGKDFSYTTKDGKKVDQNMLIKLRSKILHCNDCSHNSNIFMCLQCPNVGCSRLSHDMGHAKSSGHIFGIDPSNGHMMCFKCRDYVSEPRLERIRITQIYNCGKTDTFTGMPIYDREHDTDKKVLIMSDSRLPTYKASTGLRGIVNMGSTCFMSSIIQCLVHNPFVRNHFFSGHHDKCGKPTDECISCCIGEIFQDFYTSTSTSGFGPVSLLTASWKVKRSLAGYSEQDAHEFLQFILNQLHKNDYRRDLQPVDSTNTSGNRHKQSSCLCITHTAFSGELQSSITCMNCSNVRETIDPMLDLSLEISNKHGGKETTALKSLEECLDKFTHPEALDVTYSCSSCNTKSEAMKRLQIKKLPPTLGIQLKRFEHLATSTKLETHVKIPIMIDMSKYTANPSENKKMIYELYSVVCHIGSVNTGHYISMVKNREGTWFKFNDAVVTRISQEDVLKSNAYLLFYVIHES